MYLVKIGNLYINFAKVTVVEFNTTPKPGNPPCALIRCIGDTDMPSLFLEDPQDIAELRAALDARLCRQGEKTYE